MTKIFLTLRKYIIIIYLVCNYYMSANIMKEFHEQIMILLDKKQQLEELSMNDTNNINMQDIYQSL